MTDFDHKFTENIICPHCGNSVDAADYLADGNMSGWDICDECGNAYNFEADVEVIWRTTKKADNKANAADPKLLPPDTIGCRSWLDGTEK